MDTTFKYELTLRGSKKAIGKIIDELKSNGDALKSGVLYKMYNNLHSEPMLYKKSKEYELYLCSHIYSSYDHPKWLAKNLNHLIWQLAGAYVEVSFGYIDVEDMHGVHLGLKDYKKYLADPSLQQIFD